MSDALGTLGDVPGIGPWTLAYVAMRALRDPDAFMVGDLGVRKGFEALGLGSTPKEILGRAEAMAPLARVRRDASLARTREPAHVRSLVRR